MGLGGVFLGGMFVFFHFSVAFLGFMRVLFLLDARYFGLFGLLGSFGG